MSKKAVYSLSIVCVLALSPSINADVSDSNSTKKKGYSVVLPTVSVEAMEEDDVTKGYVKYEDASVTRNNLTIKETPYTIDTLNIQKNKNYGTNDLSSILEGNAGIDTTYDMRSDNIYIRGFNADSNDIYRDGIRESGQVRRSTANIERVEILKGPASVLYGRSNGGGIINMVSKYANFSSKSNVGVQFGSFKTRGANIDINEPINDNVAVRFVGDITRGSTFRDGLQKEIDNKSHMFSPSVTITNHDNITWTGQYTYDYAKRTPDRGPNKEQYDLMGMSYDKAFTHDGDYVEDKMHILRSDLDVSLANDWELNWKMAYRKADQDFDHYYLGTYDTTTKLLNRSYAWQNTENKTISSSLTLNGKFDIANIENRVTMGLDVSKEERNPTLFYSRNHYFDPFNPSSWTRIDKPAASIKNEHRGTSGGIFLEDVISITPSLKFALGGRFDKYKFKSTDINNNSNSYDGDSFSPRFGIVYDINKNHTVYASYTKSFAPYGGRGYLGISATSDSSTFNEDPQYNEQYEVGIKSDWLDGRLNTTLSLYNLEHNNIRYQPDDTNPTLWAVRGKERSRGVELSMTGEIFNNLYARSSLGLKNAKVIEDKSKPINEGHYLSNTAKFNGNIFLRYAPSSFHMYGEVGLTHVGTRYFYSRSGKESTLDAFNRVDMLIGYNYNNFNITLGILNLLDKEYWRSSVMPGSSRSATLRVNYKF